MHIDFSSSQRTSLGVEWELELVDLDTRQLTAGADEILIAISPNGDGVHPKAKHELLQSCVEVITGICQTVAEARADLAETVAQVAKAAEPRNLGVMCSGTHPMTDWATQRITADERYATLVERNQWMARQLQIFGIHVHCGIRSPDKAIPILNGLLAYVPHFLALSASSPYWIGSDTGLASYRSKVFEALPTAGLPFQLSRMGRVREVHGRADLLAGDPVHPRGVVGHPAAPRTSERSNCASVTGCRRWTRSPASPRCRSAWWNGSTASSTMATRCPSRDRGWSERTSGEPLDTGWTRRSSSTTPVGCSRLPPPSRTSSRTCSRSLDGSIVPRS